MQQTTKDYTEYLQQRKAIINQALAKYLMPEEGFHHIVEEGMYYAVCGGGKRLRPLLLLEGAALAGVDVEEVLPAACSIELLHTYSLVHDDLPAMDNDAMRRGRATCHIQFGEANAILIGDALLTRAFGLLAEMSLSATIHASAVLRVLRMLGNAAGSRGMIGGQVMDLEAEQLPPEKVPLETLHEMKTGALLEYALTAGAVLGGLPGQEIQCLKRYARKFGMAFQITDDILDVVGNEAELGKPVGSDEKNHKATYVRRYGLEGARVQVQEYIASALTDLQGISGDTGFLQWLIVGLSERKA